MKKLFLLLLFVSCFVFYSSAQDRSVYEFAMKEVYEKVNVEDILNHKSLENIVNLKRAFLKLKDDLLNELKVNIIYLEKKLARKEIERSVWLNTIIDYITLSYNLELLLYACELKIEDANKIQKY